MNNRPSSSILALILILTLTSQVWPQQADSTDVSEQQEYFIIESRHRLYPDFVQIDTVGMDQPFYIGEDEWKAAVVGFNPHLGITQKGEALQMSDTLYNPAVRVRVSVDDEIKQESWGFYVLSSPHFKRDDLLAFKLVDFKVSDKYVEAPARK
ncbi:MAG: hypothetical protein AB1483_12010 [Candidatus Zixiibacteriota bacterium]